ncbi:MAG: biotin synthase BioB [Thermus sp.]|nr:biotin synthase BioB [Thermus sp.]
MSPEALAEKALAGLSPSEALKLFQAPWEVLAEAALLVKARRKGQRIRLIRLLNIKSGGCPEDCAYCAQSAHYSTPAPRHPLLSPEAILQEAERAKAAGARRFCLVGAYRMPSREALGRIGDVAPSLKALGLEVCVSLGLLSPEMALALKEAGVDYYNHNLNTSGRLYPRIATTHLYAHRLETLRLARQAGLKLCSGVILGMGERPEDVVEMAYTLKALGVESVPINFLLPIPGTPLGENPPPGYTPEEALKALSLFRLVLPEVELRASAGRERYLSPYASWVFRIADSVFIEGYLTQKGTPLGEDWQRIQELGLEVC